MPKAPPLVFEFLEDQRNHVYLTLIEHKKIKYLTIVENIVGEEIQAYVLDQLSAEGIDHDWFIAIATRWFYGASDRYPLSFEFAKLGQSDVVKKVLKTFNVQATSRVIGKLFVYPLSAKPRVKRRRAVTVPETVTVTFKKTGP